jgi:hypothetical protein
MSGARGPGMRTFPLDLGEMRARRRRFDAATAGFQREQCRLAAIADAAVGRLAATAARAPRPPGRGGDSPQAAAGR